MNPSKAHTMMIGGYLVASALWIYNLFGVAGSPISLEAPVHWGMLATPLLLGFLVNRRSMFLVPALLLIIVLPLQVFVGQGWYVPPDPPPADTYLELEPLAVAFLVAVVAMPLIGVGLALRRLMGRMPRRSSTTGLRQK